MPDDSSQLSNEVNDLKVDGLKVCGVVRNNLAYPRRIVGVHSSQFTVQPAKESRPSQSPVVLTPRQSCTGACNQTGAMRIEVALQPLHTASSQPHNPNEIINKLD